MMDSLLRYNYYIQNMPTNDIELLQTHIQTEVISRVACRFEKGDLDVLFEEVNNDFVKLQNTMLFQEFLKSNDSSKLFSKPLDLESPKPKKIP
jgi:dynein heavy chain